MKCSLCSLDIEVTKSGWDKGNNPQPIREPSARCCDWCDKNLVIPLRIRMIQNRNQLSGKAADFFAARALPSNAFDGGKSHDNK